MTSLTNMFYDLDNSTENRKKTNSQYKNEESVSSKKLDLIRNGVIVNEITVTLKDIIEKEYQTGIDDQGRWSIQYLLNDDIIIDQERDFFFSTLDTKDSVKIEGNEVLLLNLDAYIIHDNGPFNDNTIKLTNILNENG